MVRGQPGRSSPSWHPDRTKIGLVGSDGAVGGTHQSSMGESPGGSALLFRRGGGRVEGRNRSRASAFDNILETRPADRATQQFRAVLQTQLQLQVLAIRIDRLR